MSTAPALEIKFQLHQGPRINTDALDARSAAPSGRLPRVTQILALAIKFEDMIRTGEAQGYADIARLSGLSRERVSQIARLNYLAPEIQVELLYVPPTSTGKYPLSEVVVRKIANILSWEGQRLAWTRLKNTHRLG